MLPFKVLFSILFTSLMVLSDTGPNSAGTGTNDAGVGSAAWDNPSRIVSSNTSYAIVYGAGDRTSNYLKATNFGFSVPSGATIDGVKVEIEKRATMDYSTGYIRDVEVKLIKGGTISGDNKGNTSTNWSLTQSYVTHGGATDLWGLSLTDADVNASNFGVSIYVFINNDDPDMDEVYAYVDHIRVTVYYTAGGGGGSSTANPLLFIGN